MTDIDPKALEHACQCAGRSVHHFDRMALDLPLRASIVAHARAIEQHEQFKREVSSVCEHLPNRPFVLDRFIIAKPKPDPLEDVLQEAGYAVFPDDLERVRAALAARGLKIVEVGHD